MLPFDSLYQTIMELQKEALDKRSAAMGSWETEKVHYWLGQFDGLQLVIEQIRPFVSQWLIDAHNISPARPSSVQPLGETENLSPPLPEPVASGQCHSVTVATDDLTAALKRLAKFRKKRGRNEMACISYDDGLLYFSMLYGREGVPAEGTWPSDIIIQGHLLYNCAKVPPLGTRVAIRAVEGKLFIGTSATPIQLGPS